MAESSSPIGTTIALLETLANLIDQREGSDGWFGIGLRLEAALLRSRADALRRGVINVVAVGEFNSGKSTLLNALLGEALLPVQTTAATAVVTSIVYGERAEVKVFERGVPEPRLISPETYHDTFHLRPEDLRGDEWHATPERFREVEYVELERRHPLLSLGARLFDTPGLGEQQGRTQLSLRFSRRAHIVLFVVNATRSLGYQELELLRSLGHRRLEHVFVVVTHADLLGESEQADVRDWLRGLLAELYSDDAGTPDTALFGRRVAFVNARTAMVARLAGDEAAWERAGMVPLAAELAQMLSQTEQTAVLRSEAEEALVTFAVAQRRIRQRRELLEAPELPRAQTALEQELEQLEIRRRDIRRPFRFYGELMAGRLHKELLALVDQMEATWDEDASRYFAFKEVTLVAALRAAVQRKGIETLERMVQESLQAYLGQKFQTWAEQAAEDLGPEIDQLVADLEPALAEFGIALDRAAGGLALGEGSEPLIEQRRFAERILAGIEPGRVVGEINSRLVGVNITRQVIQNLTLFLVLSIFTPMWLLQLTMALIVAYQGARIAEGVGGLAHRLRASIKQRLFQSMRQEIEGQRSAIASQIQSELDALAAQVDSLLATAIDEVRSEQQRAGAQRQDSLFATEQERNRLDEIEREMERHVEQLWQVATGSELSSAERERALSHKAPVAERIVASEPMPPVEPLPAPDLAEPTAIPRPEPSLQPSLASTEIIKSRLSDALRVPFFGRAERRFSSDERIAAALASLDGLEGLDEVRKRVRSLAYYQLEEKRRREAGLPAPRDQIALHMVFTGNPGTGKTTVARVIGQIYAAIGLLDKGHTHFAEAKDLVGQYVGHTAPRTEEAVQKALDGVLFIDEAYQLARSDRGGFGQEAIDTLLTRMEELRGRLVVIVAGYPKEMQQFLDSNPGVRRRFPPQNVINFTDFTPEQLFKILVGMVESRGLKLAPELKDEARALVASLHTAAGRSFGNAGEMRNLAEGMVAQRHARVQLLDLPLDAPITVDDIPTFYQQYRPGGENLAAAIAELEGMVGLKSVKGYMRRIVARAEVERRGGRPAQPRNLAHFALIGNSGTGKSRVLTLLARVLRGSGLISRDTIVALKPQDLLTSLVREQFSAPLPELDQAAGGILLIDNAHVLAQPYQDNELAIQGLTDIIATHGERLTVVLTGYKKPMNKLLADHPGLRLQRLEFDDLAANEMIELLQRWASEQGFTLTGSAEARADVYLEVLRQRTEFANAWSVRDLLETMIAYQAERTAQTSGTRVFVADDVPAPAGGNISTARSATSLHLWSLVPPGAADRAR